jgi:hypothetical protein
LVSPGDFEGTDTLANVAVAIESALSANLPT